MLRRLIPPRFCSRRVTYFCFSTQNQENKLKQQLLAASMIQARISGWNYESIAQAAHSLGYSSVLGGSLLPDGPIEVVNYAMDVWFKQFSLQLQEQPLNKMGITDRVRTGVILRLQLVQPYQKTWPQAMALGMEPRNLATTALKIHKISDQIWFRAGDTSIDYNWYTKRGLLSQLYILTELFMLQDTSHSFSETEAFLDRRLKDILSIGQTLNHSKNIIAATGGGIMSLIQSLIPPRETSDLSALITQILKNQEQAIKTEKNSYQQESQKPKQ